MPLSSVRVVEEEEKERIDETLLRQAAPIEKRLSSNNHKVT